MTKDALLEKIKRENPRLVYLSGKTSTGKSTLANELRDMYGYSKIELDDIVFSAVIEPFNVEIPTNAFRTVYRDTEPKEQVEAFIEASKKEIKEILKLAPIVVEGSIAKTRVLKEVFSGNLQDFILIQ
jgi:guanylate kinase